MSSVNKVILIGNLGRDPEIKTFANGGRIANFSIATSEKWTDKNSGEKKERTEWHSISVNGEGLIGVVERYIVKGSKVYIEGQLRTRKWQDQAGNDRYTTEVVLSGFNGKLVMLDNQRSGRQRSASEDTNPASGLDRSTGGRGGSFADELDDDIPF